MKKLETIENKMDKMSKEFKEIVKSLEFTQDELEDAKKKIEVLDKSDKEKQRQIDQLKEKVKHQDDKLVKMELYSRRHNIVIDGVNEGEEDDCVNIVSDIFKSKLMLNDIQIDKCHRNGPQKNHQKRQIICRLAFQRDRELVLKKKPMLKGTGIYISEDLGYENNMIKRDLSNVLKIARKSDKKVTVENGMIKYKGKLYHRNDINNIPIDLTRISEKIEEGTIIYGGEFSPLSSLYKCDIK